MIKNNITYPGKWKFTINKAKDSYFWDHNNRQIIDFSSGWNVANLGWNNDEIAEAIIKQTRKNVFVPSEMGEKIQYDFAQALIDVLPKSLNIVSRATGGAEANEQAYKIARAVTGRKKILGFYGSYHGQTFANLSVGFRKRDLTKLSPLVPDFININFPSITPHELSEKEVLDKFLQKLESKLRKNDVAGVITEPGIITGWGSTLIAPKGYLQGVRKLTQDYGTLLILDEVGTGFSRTGRLFGMEHEQIVPDIVTFAKAISNGGAAIGATVSRREIVDPIHYDAVLGSTFGWTPIACAASLASLKIHIRDKVWEQSEQKGNWLKYELANKLDFHPKFGGVRGLGMEIGLMFVENKKSMMSDSVFAEKVQRNALKNNLYLISDYDGNIQLMPPLIMPWDILKESVDIIVKSVKESAYE